MKRKNEKLMRKQIDGRLIRIYISIVLAVFILLSSAIYLMLVNLNEKKSAYEAIDGYLDLSDLDFGKEKWVELNGEWQFFEGQFLPTREGGDFSHEPTGAGEQARIIRVPGPWQLSSGTGSPSRGFGTFRLLVTLPEQAVYGLRAKTVRSASRIFINGQEIAGMGRVASEAGLYQPMSRYCTGFTQSRDGRMEIIIHVANFYYSKGGILSSLEFGPSGDMITRISRETGFEIIVIFSFISVGVLFFILYLLTNRGRHLLAFSLGCFFMGLYLSVMNNQVLNLMFDLGFASRTRVQIISMVGAITCFLTFVERFFRTTANRKLSLAVKVFMMLTLSGALINPLWVMTSAQGLFQVILGLIMLTSFGYMTFVMIRAMFKKMVAVEYILVAVVSLASYWFSLLAKALLGWKMTYYSEWMLIFVLLSMVYLIGDRLYSDYLEMTELADKRLEREFEYFFSQISPHFVYNTINTIIALSYEDDDKTRDALNHLAMYFRGKLAFHKQKGLIPLETELEMVVAYLEIEKMRYQGKLHVEYGIAQDLDCMIPPLTIQPLAENAVKHGIASLDGAGTVRITADRAENGFTRITVEDDGRGVTDEERAAIFGGDSERLGLKNVTKKIELMPRATIQFSSSPGRGTIVELMIPEGGIHADLEGRAGR